MEMDWGAIHRSHEYLRQEFDRLLVEPNMKPIEPGMRVIIAAGLIGHGYPWIRTEVEVVDIADTSILISFLGKNKPEWIHPALITDVLS